MSHASAYEVVKGWEQLPQGWRHRDVSGVAVDSNDRVYLLTRTDTRVIVYDRDGTFIQSWGEGIFTDRTHCLRFAADGSLYTVDDGDHTVRRFSPEGKPLMTLGTPGVPSDTGYDESFWGRDTYRGCASITRGGPPFNKPTGVAIAPSGDLYVCDGYANARVHRFSAEGKLIQSWGEGIFTDRTHCLRFAADGTLYTVDDGDHTVRRFSPEGKLLMTLGTPRVPSDTGYNEKFWGHDTYRGCASITHGGPPFNKPTGIAIAPTGELYVSDGYANARVHRFSAEGKLIQSWGEPGPGPGQFNLPHGIFVVPDGRVFVADRENERVQIFNADGKYLTEWTDVQRPTDVFVDRDGLVYVSELGWRAGDRSFARGPIEKAIPGRMSIFDLDGKLVTRWGGADPCAAGSFCAPHAMSVDSRGDLYVAEVVHSFAGKRGLAPPDCHTFQKFTRR